MIRKNILLLVALVLCLSSFGQKVSSSRKDDKLKQIYTMENILSRSSVRDYTDKPLEKDQIITLLKAAMAAPSAVNKQPWDFIVITQRDILDNMAQLLPNAKMLHRAPCAIVVCGNLKKALDGENQEYWIQDCSAATENLLLAAHALNLGAVWTGVYPSKERVKIVQKVLNLPEFIIPLNVIPIGYPQEEGKPKDKFKDENIHWERW
ncbi:MAG: nitroreductase family protein [Bacteroidales bacterium]|jgi:nitroreductase|nr:nitroreductase family protein [Bacteroidales bacterium]